MRSYASSAEGARRACVPNERFNVTHTLRSSALRIVHVPVLVRRGDIRLGADHVCCNPLSASSRGQARAQPEPSYKARALDIRGLRPSKPSLSPGFEPSPSPHNTKLTPISSGYDASHIQNFSWRHNKVRRSPCKASMLTEPGPTNVFCAPALMHGSSAAAAFNSLPLFNNSPPLLSHLSMTRSSREHPLNHF